MPNARAGFVVTIVRISDEGTWGYFFLKSLISRNKESEESLARLSVPRQTGIR